MSSSIKSKIWYSFFDDGDYNGNEPPFFDVTEISWAKIILNNKDIIIKEFNEVKHNSYSPYFNKTAVNKKHVWKTISFKFWTVNYYKNQKLYPKINSVFSQIPQVLTISINKLEPGGRITPHNGDSNAFYRCHFGLEIPETLPKVGFKVLNEEVSWKEGELLIFCDANKHEAWNNSDRDRYILVFDIMRPEFQSKKRAVVSTIAASIFLQSLATKLPFILKLPKKVMIVLHFSAKSFSRIYIPIRNAIHKLFN